MSELKDAKRQAMRNVISATLQAGREREAQLDVIEQQIMDGKDAEAIAGMRIYLGMKKPPQRSETDGKATASADKVQVS